MYTQIHRTGRNVQVDHSYTGGGDFDLRVWRSGERGSIFRKWLQSIIDPQWHHPTRSIDPTVNIGVQHDVIIFQKYDDSILAC